LIDIVGFIIGVISGTIQFWLLSKFTGSVVKGKISGKTILFAVSQFFFPFAVLLISAIVLLESLLWTGVGMGAALVVSAVIKFLIVSGAKKPKNR
jgi:hypothetical protein